jgi:putative ATP-dependent endonuclease of the OLD family
MPKIRYVEIRNFRSIKSLDWSPGPGVNCLVGPGDSGKSTILDAIDVCLAARRSWNFSDSDFYNQDVSKSLTVRLTIGDLPDALLDLDVYGDYLRGYDADLGMIEDEPLAGSETILTLELIVEADLEPQWRLYSERMADSDRRKALAWKDRVAMAPARLGNHSSSNLSWSRGSVLNRLSDGRVDVGTALVDAARQARLSFGEKAGEAVTDVLETVTATAKELGIDVGSEVKALLDAHAVSFTDGAISLHSENGIPLRSLGIGSARLLLAGLHRRAAAHTSVLLADEIEYGLEPHRLIRLLHSLGAKDKDDALQVFMTTHSPVAIRELNGDQVYVVRCRARSHSVGQIGTNDAIQGALRTYPEALLARTVVVCEGASEIGLLRGIDQHRASEGGESAYAAGCAFLDSSGGSPERTLQRAQIFRGLGFKTIAFLDSDVELDHAVLKKTRDAGVHVFLWVEGSALEKAMFFGVSNAAVQELIGLAIELNSEEEVDSSIADVSANKFALASVREAFAEDGTYSAEIREVLGKAAKLTRKGNKGKPARKGWFKSITRMEAAGKEVIGPGMKSCRGDFKTVLEALFAQIHD